MSLINAIFEALLVTVSALPELDRGISLIEALSLAGKTKEIKKIQEIEILGQKKNSREIVQFREEIKKVDVQSKAREYFNQNALGLTETQRKNFEELVKILPSWVQEKTKAFTTWSMKTELKTEPITGIDLLPPMPSLNIGEPVIGRPDWEVVSFLASGGYGEVYLIRNTISRELQALKLFSSELTVEMRDEYSRMNDLNHSRVAKVVDIAKRYIIFEYVDGLNLRDFLLHFGSSIPMVIRLNILHQLAEALAYIHSKGIVHRDIKPSNIMIEADFSLKLIDLGIAREAKSKSTRKSTSRTNTHAIGTIGYVSANAENGGDPLPSDDIYSFGVVAFNVLNGSLERPVNIVATLKEKNVPKSISYFIEMLCDEMRRNNPKKPKNGRTLLRALRVHLEEKIIGRNLQWSTFYNMYNPKIDSFDFTVRELSKINHHKKPLVLRDILFYYAKSKGLRHPKKVLRYKNFSKEFILIPPGTYMQGLNHSEAKLRKVHVSRPFWISTFPVTQREYMAVTERPPPWVQIRPRFILRNTLEIHPEVVDDPDHPVVCVDFNDCVAFCEKLDNKFRLPFEYEWEYVARAGGQTGKYPFNPTPETICCSEREGFTESSGNEDHPWLVESILGNVFEFCNDTYKPYPDCSGIVENPVELSPSAYRVVRGGSFKTQLDECTPAFRSKRPEHQRSPDLGFRLTRELSQEDLEHYQPKKPK